VPRRPRTLVVAGLCRRAGRILLTRRRADQPMPLLWELPGGKIEAGEAPREALRREIAEELGVRARVGRPVDVIFHPYRDFDLMMMVFSCRVFGEPRPLQVAAVRWVEPAGLAGYKCLPADRALMRRLAGRSMTRREATGGVR